MRAVHLKLYPDQSVRMLRRLIADLVVGLWCLVWGALGFLVYEAVLALRSIGNGIADTGHALNAWAAAFRSVVPQGVPGLSDWLNGLASGVQTSSGDRLVSLGAQVDEAVFHLAILLGLLVAIPPILIALAVYVPPRWREAREMGAALAFVRAADLAGNAEGARAVLAYRAVASLSFAELMRLSPDPVGDLAHHDYERLAWAMLERAGLGAYRLPSPPLQQLGPRSASGAIRPHT